MCRVRAAFPPLASHTCNEQAISCLPMRERPPRPTAAKGPAIYPPTSSSSCTVGPDFRSCVDLTGPASMIARVAYTNVGSKKKKKATYQTSRLDCLRATKVLAPSEARAQVLPPPTHIPSVCLPVYLCVLSLSSVCLYSRTSVCLSTSIGLARSHPSPPTLHPPPAGGVCHLGMGCPGAPSPIPCNIAGVGLPKAVVCSTSNCLFENLA